MSPWCGGVRPRSAQVPDDLVHGGIHDRPAAGQVVPDDPSHLIRRHGHGTDADRHDHGAREHGRQHRRRLRTPLEIHYDDSTEQVTCRVTLTGVS
jgi:hypothetical protein